jgi:hypothetical protein
MLPPVGAPVPTSGRYRVQGMQMRAGLELWARRDSRFQAPRSSRRSAWWGLARDRVSRRGSSGHAASRARARARSARSAVCGRAGTNRPRRLGSIDGGGRLPPVGRRQRF